MDPIRLSLYGSDNKLNQIHTMAIPYLATELSKCVLNQYFFRLYEHAIVKDKLLLFYYSSKRELRYFDSLDST